MENVEPEASGTQPLSPVEAKAYARSSLFALLIVLSWPVSLYLGMIRGDEPDETRRYLTFAWLGLSWGLLWLVFRCPRCKGYLGAGMGGKFCPKCRVALRGNP